MTEQNEPSMEDILASIRNILADEEDKAKDVAEKQPESSAADGNDAVFSWKAFFKKLLADTFENIKIFDSVKGI